MKLTKLFCSLLLVGILQASASAQPVINQNATSSQEKKGLQAGDKAPNFKHKDINGKEVSLSDFAGKYVYIDIWATWCGPCKKEIPSLKEAEIKMHGKNIVFMSVSVDKNIEDWKKMVVDMQLSGVQLHNGGDRIISDSFVVPTIPRFILIGPDGKVVDPNMMRPSRGEEFINYLNSLPKM